MNCLFFEQVHFSYKRPGDQFCKASINQYPQFKVLNSIKIVLTREEVLNEFTNSCFGHFLNFDATTQLSSVVVHNILAREINVENHGVFEIWFGIR